MGASISKQEGPLVGINVTPLVDVVLVLLIVLMVTANFLAAQSIPLDLPKGSSGEEVGTTLAVSVDKEGAIFVDGQPSNEEGLHRAAHAALTKDANARAVIAADGRNTHARVVKVMDILREEKIVRFAIQVEPEKAKP
ncbi:ExbD/TolR family protein [Pendulispora albinea]|uniref:Biopolymer transporter ExbD n=1 Tax=Pendulispora albinea TaxID=2741071 RepID=A0ABZ2LYA0_9BACT